MKTHPIKSSTVVITGASSGIGKAAALRFAKEGANVVLASRSPEILEDLASECEKLGAKALVVETDVSDERSVQNLFETAKTHFGEINVWINNAGVGAIGEFDKTPLDAHEQVLKTNLFGPLFGTYAVLPYFKTQGKGIIINTNSTGAFIGAPYSAAYSASKFGLKGLSEALRFELKKFPEIHVCELIAAFVDTPAPSHAANYEGKKISPPRPLVDPEDMAEGMIKLAKRPKASLHIGVLDRLGRLGHFLLPELSGRIMQKMIRSYLKKTEEVPNSNGNLFSPSYNETSIHGAS